MKPLALALALVLVSPAAAVPHSAPGRPGYKPPFKAASSAQMGAMHQVMALNSMKGADYPLRGFLEGSNATPKSNQHAYGALLNHLPADFFTRTAAMTNPRNNGARLGSEALQAQLAEAYERAKPEVRDVLAQRVSRLAADVAAGKAGKAELDEALAALAPFQAFGDSAAPALRNLRALSQAVAAGQVGAVRAQRLAQELSGVEADPAWEMAKAVTLANYAGQGRAAAGSLKGAHASALNALGVGVTSRSAGVVVWGLEGAAARSGLVVGDVITRVGGIDLRGPSGAGRLDTIVGRAADKPLSLEVLREGRLVLLSVDFNVRANPTPKELGLEVRATGAGFLIESAAAAAREAGLSPGHIIVRANRRVLGEGSGVADLRAVLVPDYRGYVRLGVRHADGREYTHDVFWATRTGSQAAGTALARPLTFGQRLLLRPALHRFLEFALFAGVIGIGLMATGVLGAVASSGAALTAAAGVLALVIWPAGMTLEVKADDLRRERMQVPGPGPASFRFADSPGAVSQDFTAFRFPDGSALAPGYTHAVSIAGGLLAGTRGTLTVIGPVDDGGLRRWIDSIRGAVIVEELELPVGERDPGRSMRFIVDDAVFVTLSRDGRDVTVRKGDEEMRALAARARSFESRFENALDNAAYGTLLKSFAKGGFAMMIALGVGTATAPPATAAPMALALGLLAAAALLGSLVYAGVQLANVLGAAVGVRDRIAWRRDRPALLRALTMNAAGLAFVLLSGLYAEPLGALLLFPLGVSTLLTAAVAFIRFKN